MALRIFIAALLFLGLQTTGLLLLRRRLRDRPLWRRLGTLAFALGNLPWLVILVVQQSAESPSALLSSLVIRPFLIWQMGVLIWLFLNLDIAVVDFCMRQMRRLTKAAPPDPERRRLIMNGVRVAMWSGLGGASLYGLVRAERQPLIVRHRVPVADLPRELEGVKIAQLTDLHVGFWTSDDQLGRAFATAAELQPHLLVLTGDLIDHNVRFAEALIKHLPLVDKTPLGTIGVTGNHDVYTGADGVAAALSGAGVKMLRNAHISLGQEGLPLTVLGVDDPGRRWLGAGPKPSLERAITGAPEGDLQILLSHRPTNFAQARELGIPITMSGHTHGGQFGIPGGPNLASLAFEFNHGLYRRGDSHLCVSAGIGAVGVPIRVGVAPEVVVLELTRA